MNLTGDDVLDAVERAMDSQLASTANHIDEQRRLFFREQAETLASVLWSHPFKYRKRVKHLRRQLKLLDRLDATRSFHKVSKFV